MMSASECREFASWYSDRANEMSSPRRAEMLRNVARSLSDLAVRLDMMTDDEREARRSGHQGSDAASQIVTPPAVPLRQ